MFTVERLAGLLACYFGPCTNQAATIDEGPHLSKISQLGRCSFDETFRVGSSNLSVVFVVEQWTIPLGLFFFRSIKLVFIFGEYLGKMRFIDFGFLFSLLFSEKIIENWKILVIIAKQNEREKKESKF